MEKLISKAAVLLEALPYIQRFRGETFVVKYGGSFMDSSDPAVRNSVARDVVFLEAVGINPVVVHGGGKAISRAMGKAGLDPEFVHGHRVTDERTVEIVDQTLSREINPEIVDIINRLGGRAEGFPGTRVFGSQKRVFQDDQGNAIDTGFVGEVTSVETSLLQDCIERGITPIVSPTATGPEGKIYNCNADTAAAQVAIALKAKRLVFMSDVPGLLHDPQDPGTVIPHLQVDQVEALKAAGVIASGMIPKVQSAVEAIQAGVTKVSFVDGRVNHAVLLEIFTDAGVGTEIVL